MGLILGLMLVGSTVSAQTSRIQVAGSARVRAEFRENTDFNDNADDYIDFIASRFRLDFKVQATEKVNIFLQPQFSKTWGEPEFVPTATDANTPANTSAATNDSPIDVHQGYFGYQANESFLFILGRRELNYGDELLVGGVGWSNVGRSFDLAQAAYKHAYGSMEVFHSSVVDRNTTGAGPGDREFSGVYAANRISENIEHADAYIFYLNDPSTSPKSSTTAYGMRLKSSVGEFDYRAEMTFEDVKAAESTGERQYNFEAGYTFDASKKNRVAVEYFSASGNFDQLFPTGHKWLGYADLFSRRNIEGYHARVSGQILSGLVASFDYYHFERQDTSRSVYKFNGTTAYGATGDSAAIANEYDLVLAYTLDENLTLEGGAARVVSGNYLKDNGGSDEASFYYLQIATSF
ncbi:MAG: alginate export family protein [Bdellovibrionales bacterium]